MSHLFNPRIILRRENRLLPIFTRNWPQHKTEFFNRIGRLSLVRVMLFVQSENSKNNRLHFVTALSRAPICKSPLQINLLLAH
jgi:hypothetical protein